MSTTIDDRVVEMRFDNKNFESNVATTMSTLDKFKEKLNLKGATKGLEDVDSTARKIDFSALTGAAETVGLKFNAMYTIADQALRNIVDSAMAAGKRIVSALTIDPIKTGLSEYETQINAVQTILANTESKGSTLEDVTAALDALNTYADKTIYNFTEMTRNIGTFTAAGVDLDTSVTAIQGIANLAAVSGSNAQQASTAMYQLSQALSSGTVKLMDWNSVTNAGMGGQVFQDALKETARVHGVEIDSMIEEFGSFRETLQKGWLTSDVLLETLDKFTMSTEGLTEAEIEANREKLRSKGYTEDQIEAIFKLGNTATNAATKVKTFTQLWDTLQETAQSGWTNTWEIIMGDFEEAKVLFSDLYNTIAPMIEASGNARNELLQGWKDAGGRTALIDSVYNVFYGVLSIVKPIKEAFREIFPPITVKQLVAFTEGFRDLTAKIKLSEETSDKLKRTFKGVFAIFDIGKELLSAAFKLISPLFGKVDDLGGGVLSLTASLGDWLVSLRDSIKEGNIFGKAVDKIKEGFAKVKSFIQPAIDELKNFGNAFADNIDKVEFRLEPLKAIGNAIKSIFTGLGKVIGAVAPWVVSAVKGIGSVLSSLMDHIASAFEGAKFESMFDLVNGGIFAAIGVFIAKFIKSGRDILKNAGGFLKNINGILEGVGDALGAFTESLKAEALKKIATAIAILAAALLVLSFIDSDKLTLSLVAISTLFAELMGSMTIFSKLVGDNSLKGLNTMAFAMIGLSTALLILSAALKIMSTMSWSEMGVGLVALTVSITALVAAVNLLPQRKVNGAARAIQTMSVGLLILSAALKIMSTISLGEMCVALLGMVVGLGALVAAVNLLPKDTALRALGMTGLATALVILAAALKIMASMSWDDIARGLTVLGGSLIILIGALRLMKGAIPGALAMMIVAPALVVLSGALHLFSLLSWAEIGKSMVTLAGSLLIIAAAMAMMKRALTGAAALLVVSAALMVLVPVLKLLGTMSWDEIVRGLTMLAGTFTVIGLAALILKPLVPTIFALAGAITLLGVACAAIGVGVLALGAGLTAISVAGSAAALSLTTIVSSIIALIPYLIEQVGVGIIRLCEVIAGGASSIAKAATVIISALVDALVASVPKIVEGALVLIVTLLESLVKYTPTIVNFLFDFVVGVINGIAERLPDLIKAGANLVMSLFVGIVEYMKSLDPNALIEGTLAIGLMTGLMAALAAVAPLTGGALLGVLGMGAVIAELAIVLAAIGALAQIPGLDWLISEGGYFLETIGTAIGQFIGGLVGGIAQGFTSSLADIALDLAEFMTNLQPFIEGAKSFDASVMDGVKSLIGVIMALTGAGIVDSLTSWITGGSSITKFGEDLAAFGPNFKAYADSVAGIDASAITASAEAAKALAEMTQHIPNEGGVASWFAGENSISKFGEDIVKLGEGLKGFSDSIAGINPEGMTAAAGAAKVIAEMTSYIPNEGGVASWFSGENSISKFSEDIVKLGEGLSGFSTAIVGANPETMTAAAGAAKALAEMTSYIPNQGGIAAWFAGENSVSKFSEDLVTLGRGLSSFSVSISYIDTERLTAAASAAKALAQMTSYIPNEGGMAAWFAGESSISKFSADLVKLGEGLSGFSTAISGINAESLTAAAGAAKALAEMTSYIPNEGGVASWFTGENSLSKFSTDIVKLGEGLKGFSTAVEGINAENISSAANAAKALAEMTAVIPSEGGIKSWFTGETSIANFADKLPGLGDGLKGFADSVKGIEAESVTAAANAAKSLGEMTSVVPGKTDKLISFGDNLKAFGSKLKGYFEATSGISGESISATENAVDAVKQAVNLDSGKLKSTADGIDEVAKSIKNLSKIPKDSTAEFKKALTDLGETSVDAFVKSFKDLNDEIKKVAKEAMEAFAAGVKEHTEKAKSACTDIITKCSKAISDKTGSFKQAGRDLVNGFAAGISTNTYLAEAKAKAMASAAARAAKKELDEHSPSKVFYGIGDFAGKGFVNALDDYGKKSYSAGSSMAQSARSGLQDAVSKIKNIIDGNVDMQPTIRPVLDLSDVESGAGTISSLFGSGTSLGVMANVGAISNTMSRRGQNGANDELISAINSLRRDLGNLGNTTYNVNGVTYDDGSNISEAVKSIVRAAKVERRV